MSAIFAISRMGGRLQGIFAYYITTRPRITSTMFEQALNSHHATRPLQSFIINERRLQTTGRREARHCRHGESTLSLNWMFSFVDAITLLFNVSYLWTPTMSSMSLSASKRL